MSARSRVVEVLLSESGPVPTHLLNTEVRVALAETKTDWNATHIHVPVSLKIATNINRKFSSNSGKLLFVFVYDTFLMIVDTFIVDGDWSGWTEWSDCSTTCEGGVRTRSRQCDDPVPLHNGQDCVGSGLENDVCHPEPCPIACDSNPCHPLAECITDPVRKHVAICSSCRIGYEGDGFNCTDVDEVRTLCATSI